MSKRITIDDLMETHLGYNIETFSESAPYGEGFGDDFLDFFNRDTRQAKFISKFISEEEVDLDKMNSDEALEYLNITLTNLSKRVRKFMKKPMLEMFLGLMLFGALGLAAAYIRAPKKKDVINLINFTKKASASSNEKLKDKIKTTIAELIPVLESGFLSANDKDTRELIKTSLQTVEKIQKYLN